MASPIASASTAATAYTPPPYDPEIGDYSSYKPMAKTAWAQDGSDEHGLTFSDFLDVINPLQHLPIISTIYRAITGDKIGLAAKLAGDSLYGGPIGFLASGLTAAVEGIAGKSTGEMVAELAHEIFGSDGGPPSPQEARTLDSEAAHEAELSAAAQTAMFLPATVSPTPALAQATFPAPTPVPAAISAPASAVMPLPAQVQTPLPLPSPAPRPLPAAVKPEPVALKSGGDEATRRIQKSIAEARRAQASLLLASLQEDSPSPRTARRENTPRAEDTTPAAATKPVAAAASTANPYMPPEQPSAPANWSNETLAETIARYERAVAANRR